VQTHRKPPRAGERLLLIAEPLSDEPLFDIIKLLRERISMVLDSLGDTLDDSFEERSGTQDLASGLK